MGMFTELLRLVEDNPWHDKSGRFGLDGNKGVWSLYFSRPGTSRYIGVKGKKGVKKKKIKAMCGRSDRSVACKVSARFKKPGRLLKTRTPQQKAAVTKFKRKMAAKRAAGG
jgi:hypothetical protein